MERRRVHARRLARHASRGGLRAVEGTPFRLVFFSHRRLRRWRVRRSRARRPSAKAAREEAHSRPRRPLPVLRRPCAGTDRDGRHRPGQRGRVEACLGHIPTRSGRPRDRRTPPSDFFGALRKAPQPLPRRRRGASRGRRQAGLSALTGLVVVIDPPGYGGAYALEAHRRCQVILLPRPRVASPTLAEASAPEPLALFPGLRHEIRHGLLPWRQPHTGRAGPPRRPSTRCSSPSTRR